MLGQHCTVNEQGGGLYPVWTWQLLAKLIRQAEVGQVQRALPQPPPQEPQPAPPQVLKDQVWLLRPPPTLSHHVLATTQEEHPLAIPLFANGDLDTLEPDSLVHHDSGMYTGAVLSAWLAVHAGYYLTSVDTDSRGIHPTAPLVPALRTLAQSLSVSAFLVHNCKQYTCKQ